MKRLNKLEKSSIKAWYFFSFFIASFSVALFVVCYYIIVSFLAGKLRTAFIVAIIVILSLIFIVCSIFPYIKFKSFRFSVQKDRILAISGIYFLKREVILIENIEHIETVTPIYLRPFKLYNVKIYTSASSHKLPALTEGQVKEILKSVDKGSFYEKSVFKG